MAKVRTREWFNLSGGLNDLDIVLSFLDVLPEHLQYIFNDESFITLLNNDAAYGINADLFFQSFDDAAKLHIEELYRIRNLMEENQQVEGILLQSLTNVGCTGASLQLKGSLLNKSWDDVVVEATTTNTGFFGNGFIRKKVKKFLGLLNSVLGSLVRVFPLAEPLKELKEIGEHYTDVIEPEE